MMNKYITMKLREYAMQVREEYQAQIDLKQNRVMQILTVVTVAVSYTHLKSSGTAEQTFRL